MLPRVMLPPANTVCNKKQQVNRKAAGADTQAACQFACEAEVRLSITCGTFHRLKPYSIHVTAAALMHLWQLPLSSTLLHYLHVLRITSRQACLRHCVFSARCEIRALKTSIDNAAEQVQCKLLSACHALVLLHRTWQALMSSAPSAAAPEEPSCSNVWKSTLQQQQQQHQQQQQQTTQHWDKCA
jgi:hypothetical protein